MVIILYLLESSCWINEVKNGTFIFHMHNLETFLDIEFEIFYLSVERFLDMALNNVLLLSQVTSYILAFILGLCIVIPITLHLIDFKGHCLLFANGTWQESDGQLQVDWTSSFYCGYNLSLGVIFLLVTLIQIYSLTCHLYKGTDSSFLRSFIDFVLSLLLSLAALSGAALITVGYDRWCNVITLRFETCEDATLNDIDKEDGIITKMFYMHFGIAQFGAWASWTCWVGVTVFALVKICKYHQQENIRVSMAHARARLIHD